mgnify:CR=1 FL=1
MFACEAMHQTTNRAPVWLVKTVYRSRRWRLSDRCEDSLRTMFRGVVSALDRGQRRTRSVSIPLAVVYKFFEDQGNYLAAILAYYAFIAIFPLMLLASSILGFFLEGRPASTPR